jgi:hypothetical protein
MADFTFSKTGPDTDEIWKCVSCGWISTKKHFRDGPSCSYCYSSAEQIGKQESRTGMPAYRYRQLLERLEETTAGVGPSTTDSIQDYFEEGDQFIDAAQSAYENGDLDTLTDVDGVGDSTAESIALAIADRRNWENGLLESDFDLTA